MTFEYVKLGVFLQIIKKMIAIFLVKQSFLIIRSLAILFPQSQCLNLPSNLAIHVVTCLACPKTRLVRSKVFCSKKKKF